MPTKKSIKLNKVESFYIEGNYTKLEPDRIISDLKRSQDDIHVLNFIERLKLRDQQAEEAPKTVNAPTDFMIRNNRGSIVMTQAASEKTDVIKSKPIQPSYVCDTRKKTTN